LSNAVALVIGAVLAIIGGVVGEWARMIIQNYNERRAMKIGLHDEISNIKDVINKMKLTFEKSSPKVINKAFLTDLKNSMDCHSTHRQRLFLFQYKTRKTINDFYKELKDVIEENEKDIDTLSTTGLTEKHEKILPKFIAFCDRADRILPSVKVRRRTHNE
jgi:hypothetical protein